MAEDIEMQENHLTAMLLVQKGDLDQTQEHLALLQPFSEAARVSAGERNVPVKVAPQADAGVEELESALD